MKVGERMDQVSPGVQQRVVQVKKMHYIYFEKIEGQVEDERMDDVEVEGEALAGEQAFDRKEGRGKL